MASNFYSDTDGHVSETGNWNVADDFSKDMIMENLKAAMNYGKIAKFGFTNLYEELQLKGLADTDELKVEGMKYLLDTLILIIDNSIFAIKFPSDVKILEDYRKKLKEIEGIRNQLSSIMTNQRDHTKKVSINEKVYYPILDKVLEIKSELFLPLNRSHLIFTDREVFNPSDYKKKLSERIRNKG